jgi:hypothetical protein
VAHRDSVVTENAPRSTVVARLPIAGAANRRFGPHETAHVYLPCWLMRTRQDVRPTRRFGASPIAPAQVGCARTVARGAWWRRTRPDRPSSLASRSLARQSGASCPRRRRTFIFPAACSDVASRRGFRLGLVLRSSRPLRSAPRLRSLVAHGDCVLSSARDVGSRELAVQ